MSGCEQSKRDGEQASPACRRGAIASRRPHWLLLGAGIALFGGVVTGGLVPRTPSPLALPSGPAGEHECCPVRLAVPEELVRGSSAGQPRNSAGQPRNEVLRNEWPQWRFSAQPSWRPERGQRDWKYIVLHHTATETGSVESIHASHKQRRDSRGRQWLGIGYHFVIGNGKGMPDGAVEPTFRWMDQLHGAHAGSAEYNNYGIGICLIGNFEQEPPTAPQLDALEDLLVWLAGEYGLRADQVIGHGDVKATACPGTHFPLDRVMETLARNDLNDRSSPAAPVTLLAPVAAHSRRTHSP